MRLGTVTLIFAFGLVVSSCEDFGSSTTTSIPEFAQDIIDDASKVPFSLDPDSGTYDGPSVARTSGVLRGVICVKGGVAGTEWFVTLGDPPSDPMATHFSGVLDENGCMEFAVDVNWPVGETVLHTSDGSDVVAVTTIEIKP